MGLTPKERKKLTDFQKELSRLRALGNNAPTPGTPGKFDDNPGWDHVIPVAAKRKKRGSL